MQRGDFIVNFKEHIQYWINYKGAGDEYRKNNDLDCILAKGNLYADTLISLWLPLRYILDKENTSKWNDYLKYEKDNLRPKSLNLKAYDEFLYDLKSNISKYIPNPIMQEKVEKLFTFGRTRANVIILPYRKWNNIRGYSPYWDYMPHFLYDLLNTNNENFLNAIQKWVKEENLCMFFENENNIAKETIRDLSGSGSIFKHKSNQIDVNFLIDNYIKILEKRRDLIICENPSLSES